MTVLSGQLCTRGMKRWVADTLCMIFTSLIKDKYSLIYWCHCCIEKTMWLQLYQFQHINLNYMIAHWSCCLEKNKAVFLGSWKGVPLTANDILLMIHAVIEDGNIHMCELKVRHQRFLSELKLLHRKYDRSESLQMDADFLTWKPVTLPFYSKVTLKTESQHFSLFVIVACQM